MALPEQKSPANFFSRALPWLAAGLAAAVAFSVLALGMFSSERPGTQATAAIGGPFALETGDGKTVTDRDLRGAPFLVFFGYTHCPDVCPTTLAQISEVLRALGPDAKIKALFVTVDPDRDTPKLMQNFASSFDPRIIGLSGSRAAVDQMLASYRVYARKAPAKSGDYSMDHSAIIYLMDRDGKFLRAFNIERPAEQAAADLKAVL